MTSYSHVTKVTVQMCVVGWICTTTEITKIRYNIQPFSRKTV